MKKETKRTIQRIGFFMFVLYVGILMYLLFFSEGYGRGADLSRPYRYNLIPFVEIRRFWEYREQLGIFALFTNIVGNVIGFIPFGCILPVVTQHMRNGFLIILSGFLVSLTVEAIQLLTKVGCFDVDDLLLNTLGAAAGYGIFAVCDHLRRKYYGKKI